MVNPVGREFLNKLINNEIDGFQLGMLDDNDDLYKEISHVNSKKRYCINTQTGDIWYDSDKITIFSKNLLLLFVRPIHTVIRTLWDVTIIAPLAVEVYEYAQGNQTFDDLTNHTFESITDIVRRPLFGIAMTISHLAAIILGIVCPSSNSLYRTRESIGWMERKLNRVDGIYDERRPFPILSFLSPCFNPMTNVGFLRFKERFGYRFEPAEHTTQTENMLRSLLGVKRIVEDVNNSFKNEPTDDVI